MLGTIAQLQTNTSLATCVVILDNELSITILNEIETLIT